MFLSPMTFYLKKLKVRFPVVLETIQHSLTDTLALVKQELLDRQFYDELRGGNVTVVKAEIISTKKINGPCNNTKNDIVIYGYVNDANVIKTDPRLEYKIKTSSEYQKSMCFEYCYDQFDIQNETITYKCKKQIIV